MTETTTKTYPVLPTHWVGAADVIQSLETIVQQFGEDHKVEMCRYEQDGKPACIIGQLLYKLGVPVELLHQMDVLNNIEVQPNNLWDRPISSCGIYNHFAALSIAGLHFTSSAQMVMQRAQDVQDGRLFMNRSWGTALKEARKVYEGLKVLGVV